MKKKTKDLHSDSSRASRLLPLLLAGGICLALPLSAQITFKANNTEPLNQPAAWVDGLVPDPDTIAVWDDRVTGANSSSMGDTATWRGIRILNPGGDVTISGSTLILGSGGVDLSQATQNLQFSSDIDFMESQKIQAGLGRAVWFGELTRRGAVGLEFEIDPTAEVRYGGFLTYWMEGDFITAGSQIYGTHNGTDFAALENVWPNARVMAGMDIRPELYTPNPDDAIPNETIFLYDYVNTTGPGARAGGNRTVHNHRFNQPNPNFPEWFVNTSNENRTVTISSILVTENVGAQDVRFGGPGWIRISDASGGLQIFQNNTAGDLIISPGRTVAAQSGTRTISKHGPGRVIIDAVAGHGGATAVFEGTLRFTNLVDTPNHGVTVHDGGTLDLEGATLNVSGLNVRDGGWMIGRGTVTGTATNHGDIVTDVDGNSLRFEGDVVNYGTMTVLNDAHLEILGSFTNYGVLDYSDGYASLPEGFVNEGTVISGKDGPPPPINADVRISNVSRDEEGNIVVTVDSVLGVTYHLQRSVSLRDPLAEPTRLGSDADATLGNDPAGAPREPDVNYGTAAGLDVRNYDGVRQHMSLIRFDIGSLDAGHLLDEVTLDLYFSGSNRTRTFEVWGVTDETLDHWIESGEGGVTYNNFDGTLPADPGFKELNLDAVELLGTFQVQASSGHVYSTTPDSAPLGDFLRASTNNLVSFIVFMQGTDSNASYTVASRENGSIGEINATTGVEVIPPTLTIPTEASVADEASEPWGRVSADVSGNGETITFTDHPGDRARAFYRIVTDLE